MHRFEEDLPRIMKVTPSGMRAVVIFATDDDQPAMQVNGIEISQNQVATFGLDWEWYHRSSAACKWNTMSLAPRDLAAAGESIIGHELVPPTSARSFAPQTAICRGCGNYTLRRATSQKPSRTSSQSQR